jgi:type II secretory pathway predicted ATPase ExeA
MSRIFEAIRKAEESRSSSARASGGGLGVMDLPDGRGGRLWEFPARDRTSSEAPAEFESCSIAALVSAATDDIYLVPPPPEFAEQTDPSVAWHENITEGSAFPVMEAVEALETAFSNIIQECVMETVTHRTQPKEEEAVIAPALFPDRKVVDAATSPILEAAAAAEPIPFLARLGACAVQESAQEVSPTPLVSVAEEWPAPSDFLQYYGLRQQPFDVTPDPAYLYLSRSHKEALTVLSQGIENLRGFVTLVAHPGLGKTTILNKLTEDLGDSARVVHLFQTQCNANELLGYLLSELGVAYDSTDVVAMHRKLNAVLFQEMLEGRRFVLIVDEAQNLQESVLETIRLLSDFETTHSKLIQIVLAGQPLLVKTLLRPGLSQLRQRIGMVANLKPLEAAEVAEYVEHRLQAAGSSGKTVFTRDALNLIAKQSEGAPRSINNLCFSALMLGYSMRKAIIDVETVESVAKRMDLAELA